jgi:methionine biosynthesis protein MetW
LKKLDAIKNWIKEGSKILVLGCGSGELLNVLIKENKVKGFGIDIDEKKVFQAISQGLSVIQGDFNTDLSDYPEKSFDYVVAHDVIQITNKPNQTLKQCLKIGNKVIVSFPNFAYLKIRLTILLSGRMPKTKILPYEWYDTPNIHLFTTKDFKELCAKEKIQIMSERYTGVGKKEIPRLLIPNTFAEFAYFLISSP